ncbi:hypothetical protein [Solemya velum gill symbiont]|uniref:Uncharacterized protein n=3 Tax=Solemya velum gill symbiont TaxID=2340 RepID=A0A0B0H7L5_SOVGS|nr:hypothetical protein [Solemya velum gill symbiont]KHF24657.1 hypothetical protein JV46_11230 [Solemya velum gill symbiont]OOY33828.1 hypothetical protein BOV88_13170 [Solemya velum gill symbiont]OOY36454.1 hypothetical protein BOV89_12480 [Solemya velum gill symbiont]OOY38907.1 hypothetical protein BOV90_12130 [Solemya velum gill symbiont]OOY42261.1 hypothetical protein BOV91_07550 [Solemya velum gill symbiont]
MFQGREDTALAILDNDNWATQRQIADLLDVSRVTINEWHSKGLPFKLGDRKTNLYLAPLVINFQVGYDMFKQGILKQNNAALWVAFVNASMNDSVEKPIKLLKKGFNLSERQASLIVGEAIGMIKERYGQRPVPI